jgi:hypothetical protein
MMLDEEANILKDRGDDNNMVLYSGAGGTKAKKGTATKKDIECYGCHEKGHKRPECPEKERSTTAASVVRARYSGDLLLMVSTSASERTLEDWYIDHAWTQHVTGTKAYCVDYKDDRRVLTPFNGSEVISEGFGDVRLTMRLPDGQGRASSRGILCSRSIQTSLAGNSFREQCGYEIYQGLWLQDL